MHRPKVTPVPPPPAPPPSQQDPTVQTARRNERFRQMSLYGRRATILTGAQGAGLPRLSPPSLRPASY